MTDQLNGMSGANLVPQAFSDEVFEVSRSVTDPEIAQKIFEQLQPIIDSNRDNKKLAIAGGLLMEKQRVNEGMRALWDDLRARFPDDMTALRMLMRWYRRDQNTAAGIDHIAKLFPNCWKNLDQADKAITGLAELKAWVEIDEVMHAILFYFPDDRPIRMKYIKQLHEQSRFVDAQVIAQKVAHRDRMGKASQDLLDSVDARANTMHMLEIDNAPEVIDTIIALAERPRETASFENVVFYTGQLGTGGAERQMTRIACAYKARFDNGNPDGIIPQVWVKHATAASGADFFLPTLINAGVETRIVADEPNVELADLDGISNEMSDLLQLLSPDVLKQTCALIPMFRAQKTDIAYLWQDGGVVMAALAAIIAGVPRIITSFRGLPPNLRPNLYRNEHPVLYAALARLPHVTFTSNSQKSATAYEEWLSLAPGTVIVVPNAIPHILPDGDSSDHAFWSDILTKSPQCHKTVLGVFRFDANKRPVEWINAAARLCKTDTSTRFVMIGGGALFEECQKLVVELGLENRVFIAGIRQNIGFYMHRADLLMHLARMEGLPNVLIEAQLSGTPVLATPAGGTDEVVTDGLTARLLTNADVLSEKEIDALLEETLMDEVGLARMGAAALAHSAERFTVDKILGRTTELFKQVL